MVHSVRCGGSPVQDFWVLAGSMSLLLRMARTSGEHLTAATKQVRNAPVRIQQPGADLAYCGLRGTIDLLFLAVLTVPMIVPSHPLSEPAWGNNPKDMWHNATEEA